MAVKISLFKNIILNLRQIPASRQFERYLKSGLINAILTFGFFFCSSRMLSTQTAYLLAYGFGATLSYQAHTKYVFRTKISPGSKMLYPICLSLNCTISFFLSSILTSYLHSPYFLSGYLALVLNIPFGYFIFKCLFKSGKCRNFNRII